MSQSAAPAPLSGLRVIDLARTVSGPFCAQVLADLGAEVIKVEEPVEGDELRRVPPFVDRTGVYYLIANRGKRCLALDLKAPEAREIMRRLVVRADVLIENYLPTTAERLGLSYSALAELNPRLVVSSIRGYDYGANFGRPAYDAGIQAYSGIMSVTGDPAGEVARAGVALADFANGLYAAVATLAALRDRDRTGRGAHVETNLFGSAVALMSLQVVSYLMTGYVFPRLGTGHPTAAPSRAFHTATGDLFLTVMNDAQWRKLAVGLGRAEWGGDPRYATAASRIERRDEVHELVQGELRKAPRDHWTSVLDAASIAYAPVRSADEVADDPETISSMVRSLVHPVLGQLKLVGSPVRIDREQLPAELPPPLLGEHSLPILAELGFPRNEVRRLCEHGVVAVPSPASASVSEGGTGLG